MNISVELTLMPLQDDYRKHIVGFIQKLRASNLIVKENALSTQVFGPYDEVMQIVNTELKEAFNNANAIIANIKIVKSDRSNYEPSF